MKTAPKLCVVVWFAAAMACGGSGDDNGNGGGGSTARPVGKVVFSYVEEIDGSTESAVHVLDMRTGSDTVFQAVDASNDDVSVAKDGTIAQMSELDDAVEIVITTSGGDVLKRFTVTRELSFATSGAMISPDGQKVAFSLDIDQGDDRGPATYVCPIYTNDACIGLNGGRSPNWTPDGQLLVVDDEKTSIYLVTGDLSDFEKLETGPLEGADNAIMTNDGRYVIFDSGLVSHLAVFDRQTGTVRALTEGGVQQFRATLSPDNTQLLFQQPCCGGVYPIPTFYLIPFSPEETVSASYSDIEPLKDDAGEIIAVGGRAGWY